MTGRLARPSPWAHLTPDERRDIEARIPADGLLRLLGDSPRGPFMAAMATQGPFDYYRDRAYGRTPKAAAEALLAQLEARVA